ncbi:TetR family transcriptional regulator [Rhizobium leguminosarum bv. trifolii CB782]|uniref:TetR family transcriptional regulator n=1 Tax=Rhizobium hidalgonense TaxID=1538159 RepID=A0A2A6KJK3_9HYPH|nr:TetR family transcriptional regulator [Rhizobium hidalgonense]AHG46964.1 TetR family transcriptional regulator [Rhizobium leguminosarum bv. trifolii CB782]MDR9775948.1 TetR family transcriptional regulator [Rhizobium hidalgonense]MDR9811625.1 TetR family transcriptional regulator [Rhizobium hidalgonense]MDR9820139.1 TetR family transcriptional regulator [Rhizobium hidalgonense]PDT24589.1 TetR family transcriptional regulator [Rhizobium hidalgonense]
MGRSNRERTEQTRQALIDAGRRFFVGKGYAETATPEIVAAAGVTRGALYHHFEDKKALFRAVIACEMQEAAKAIEASSAPGDGPRAALIAGASAYFSAMAEPGRTRLLLMEAPAVLGLPATAAMDAENAEATLRAGLAALVPGAGTLLGPLTSLLSAAFDRAAIAIEAGGERRDYEQAITTLLDGLADHLRR